MDDGSTRSGHIGPSPRFWFEVSFGGRAPVKFLEVDGIPSSAGDVQDSPSGDGPRPAYALPSARSRPNITLKRSLSGGRSELERLDKASISLDKIVTETVRIALVDSEKKELRVWTLSNAWLVTSTGLEIDPGGNDPTIDAVELDYEAITFERG